jgi:hypothetical protein
MNIDDLTRQLMNLVSNYSQSKNLNDEEATIENRAALVGFFVEALQARGHEDYKRGYECGLREGMLKQKGLDEVEELRAHLKSIISGIKSSPDDGQEMLAAQMVVRLLGPETKPPKPFDRFSLTRRRILFRTSLSSEMNELKNMAGDLIQ